MAAEDAAAELAIRGGTVWSPAGSRRADVYLAAGRVLDVGGPSRPAATSIDARGLWVMPGVVDGHVHIPDPGRSDREDFPSGTAAAASNGTTFLLEHHHSDPVLDAGALERKSRYLSGRLHVDVGLLGAVHPGNVGGLRALWEAGAYAFKLFTCALHGAPAVTGDVLARALAEVASFDGLVLTHCEDEEITAAAGRELREAGATGGEALLAWRTLEAELAAAGAMGEALRLSGARAVIAHASHPAVVDRLRAARGGGARLLIESCPHYLWLTEDDVRARGPWAKCTPPARSEQARAGLWRLVAAREIDLISADHAPTTIEEKRAGESDIWECPFGLPGVETTLSAMLTGVAQGLVEMSTVVALMCEGPARAYGIYPRKGALRPGSDADVVIVDPRRERLVRRGEVRTKAGWSAFEGRLLTGRAVRTLVRGVTVYEEGALPAGPAHGRYVPRPGAAGRP
ncbi:MAG: amidohydrolase family protein [Chloroflexi bacterium]|nr:amidohydrolase family protein [Chloroflexota bacterium]